MSPLPRNWNEMQERLARAPEILATLAAVDRLTAERDAARAEVARLTADVEEARAVAAQFVASLTPGTHVVVKTDGTSTITQQCNCHPGPTT